jgi:hypothetical protein
VLLTLQSARQHSRISSTSAVPGRALSDRRDAVAKIVKRTVTVGAIAAGMSEEVAERQGARFAGHSFRSGFATSAAIAGASDAYFQ